MITAKEAHEKSAKVYDKKIEARLDEVFDWINSAIARGEFQICIDGNLPLEVKKRIENLGYTVNTGSQYNESWFTVSW